MEEAIRFLSDNNLININDYVVIGLSGGPDSMALLNILLEYRKKTNMNIVCAHVNHGIRKESDDEEIFVHNYCKKNNVIFEYMKLEKCKNSNFESFARKKRYDFFDSVIKKYDAKILFTAHHGDDLIETILMRLVRGSTLKGYAGFPAITEKQDYKIVRPLVFYTKSDIDNYNNINNIPYVVDKTNESDLYTRNRYRHNMLPFLKNENKNVHLKFLKFSSELFKYSNYIDDIVNKCVDSVYKDNKLYINEYIKLDDLIREKIMNFIFHDLYGDNLCLIEKKHIDIVNKLIFSNKPNMRVSLPNELVVIRNYDKVSFCKNKEITKDYKYEIKDGLIINNGIFHIVDDISDDSNYVCRLNKKNVTLPIYVRNRKNGDKICVKGLNGSKKIKDIFIDSKIKKSDRDRYPIVVDANDIILWIPGVKKSKYNGEKNEKCDIIIKYEEET